MSLASDLAHMLEHAPGSTTVRYNGVDSFGILNRSSDFVPTGDGAMMVQSKTRVLTVQNGVFSNLRVDGRILIGGVPYTIREWNDEGEDDGLQLDITVAKIP